MRTFLRHSWGPAATQKHSRRYLQRCRRSRSGGLRAHVLTLSAFECGSTSRWSRAKWSQTARREVLESDRRTFTPLQIYRSINAASMPVEQSPQPMAQLISTIRLHNQHELRSRTARWISLKSSSHSRATLCATSQARHSIELGGAPLGHRRQRDDALAPSRQVDERNDRCSSSLTSPIHATCILPRLASNWQLAASCAKRSSNTRAQQRWRRRACVPV